MQTATEMLVGGAQRRHRTPEEAYRAYQQYREDIEPVIKMIVGIRSLARPTLHLRELADGRLEITRGEDHGLPPASLETLRLLEDHLRDMARAYGFEMQGHQP